MLGGLPWLGSATLRSCQDAPVQGVISPASRGMLGAKTLHSPGSPLMRKTNTGDAMRRVEIKTFHRAWWWAAGCIVGLYMTPVHAQIDLGRILRESLGNGVRAPAANPRARALPRCCSGRSATCS